MSLFRPCRNDRNQKMTTKKMTKLRSKRMLRSSDAPPLTSCWWELKLRVMDQSSSIHMMSQGCIWWKFGFILQQYLFLSEIWFVLLLTCELWTSPSSFVKSFQAVWWKLWLPSWADLCNTGVICNAATVTALTSLHPTSFPHRCPEETTGGWRRQQRRLFTKQVVELQPNRRVL